LAFGKTEIFFCEGLDMGEKHKDKPSVICPSGQIRLIRFTKFRAARLKPPSSFRDGPQDQTRNLEIPGSPLRAAPE
jgi:hypothetical protein